MTCSRPVFTYSGGRLGNQLYYVLAAYKGGSLYKCTDIRVQQELNDIGCYDLITCDSSVPHQEVWDYKQSFGRDFSIDDLNGFVDNHILKSSAYRSVFQKYGRHESDLLLQVRCGDYIGHPWFDIFDRVRYVSDAIRWYIDSGRITADTPVIVRSDDIDMCRATLDQTLRMYVRNVDYAQSGGSVEDLIKASLHVNKILFNSTYSYWAAFIGARLFDHQCVILPDVFYVSDSRRVSADDVTPQDWIRIKTYGRVESDSAMRTGLMALRDRLSAIKRPVGSEFYRSLRDTSGLYVYNSYCGGVSRDGDRVAIVYGDDRSFDRQYADRLGVYDRYYAVNNTVLDDQKIVSIPLGMIDNAVSSGLCPQGSLSDFSHWDLLCRLRDAHSCATKRIIYLNYSTGNSARWGVEEVCNGLAPEDYLVRQNNGPWMLCSSPESFERYYGDILDSLYVACPAGNGIDTYRFWETLYLGRIPVVLHNCVTDAFDRLPVLRLDRWSQFSEKREQFEREFDVAAFDLSALDTGYWFNRFSKGA